MMQIISLGLGVQSTALYYMSSMGELPGADVAIFSDPGKERRATYKYLQFLLRWQRENNGIKIVVLNEKNLYQDLLNPPPGSHFSSLPAFTKNPDGSKGMLRRKCTSAYKIQVIHDYIRDHIYGLPKGSRRPQTEVWLGITLDEIERMSPPYTAWEVKTYPFLGQQLRKDKSSVSPDWAMPMTRNEVVTWYIKHNLPVPPKSGCVFCPYQSDYNWAQKKLNEPEDFADAVKVDEAIRNSTKFGIHNPVYLHSSCKPLAEVEFDMAQTEELGECTGNCHT